MAEILAFVRKERYGINGSAVSAAMPNTQYSTRRVALFMQPFVTQFLVVGIDRDRGAIAVTQLC